MSDRLPFVDPEPDDDRVERLVPRWHFIDPATADVGRRLLDESLAPKGTADVRLCEWKGCRQIATDRHHCLEREDFGRLAEHLDPHWLCARHHRDVTVLRNASHKWHDG